jgi:phosphatidate phosphatase APP1
MRAWKEAVQTAALAAALLLANSVSAGDDTVKPDETLHLLPTWAVFDAERDEWLLPVHGWIFEPEDDALSRRALLGTLRRALGLEKGDEDNRTFRQRALPFLCDNERGKRLAVAHGAVQTVCGKSTANGHFHGTLRVPRQLVVPSAGAPPRTAVVRSTAPDGRVFDGTCQLLAAQGVSVVSDLDDTIKISDVTDRKALLRNTFLEPFQPVPGMAALYQQWHAAGADFHYVSASPWQLYEPISAFLRAENFPAGSLALRLFRVKDRSFFAFFRESGPSKRAAIAALLDALPDRRFILVGDAGEQDPELYGELARAHPDQVSLILIRDATGAGLSAARGKAAFAELSPTTWRVFRDAAELAAVELPVAR